ncbi:glycoside hydrolase family 15 protein [Micromonospora sp. WMMA1363]|uniref:glycoside hydrolase family 15 protein n=1 Tax=Micromonospora sp. WMMA1363 TaxID=3053985 RepID=UPI00338D9325
MTSPHLLGAYALIADGYRGALVGPYGDIGWLCAPGWSDPPLFGDILGPGLGHFLLFPETRHVHGGYYNDGSLIWINRWEVENAIIESRDALAAPGDEDRVVLLRQIRTLDRPAKFRVILSPRADFGRESVEDVTRDGALWLARTGALHLRVTGAEQLRPDRDGLLEGELKLSARSWHDLVLEVSPRPFTDPPCQPGELWRATEEYWHRVAPRFAGPAQQDATLSYAILRGMTRPGGGMVAAATTSLPEQALAGRNYDYRYAWIRDQSMAGQAAALVGAHDLLDDAVSFITTRILADGDRLAPAYTASGKPVPPETRLDFLSGYPGAQPQTGNWVRSQFQLDVFGEALLVLAAAARLDRIDKMAWRAAEQAADSIERRWREPDSGIWELSTRHWTYPRLICVAGLKSVARVASGDQAGRWSALADVILADAATHGLHPRGYWKQAYDDERVDAALLMAGVRGALPAGDPRTTKTLKAVLDELGSEGYVYRFRSNRRPLGDTENAFLLCGFAAALACCKSGRMADAKRIFERNRSTYGSPGLYSEEYDVRQRRLRGNLPQAFVHALMLEAAATLGQITVCE